jgi:hypothetical protein
MGVKVKGRTPVWAKSEVLSNNLLKIARTMKVEGDEELVRLYNWDAGNKQASILLTLRRRGKSVIVMPGWRLVQRIHCLKPSGTDRPRPDLPTCASLGSRPVSIRVPAEVDH